MPRKTKRAPLSEQVICRYRHDRSAQRSFHEFLLDSLWRIGRAEGKRARTPTESEESKQCSKLTCTKGTNSKCLRKIQTSRNLSSSQKKQ